MSKWDDIESTWSRTEKNTVAALRLQVRTMKHEHEAALEEQRQELLQTHHQLRQLQETVAGLQQTIERFSAALPELSGIEHGSLPRAEQQEGVSITKPNEIRNKKRKLTSEEHEDWVVIEPSGEHLATEGNPSETTSESLYLYKRIIKQPRAFRLLKLVQNTYFAPLRCKITTFHLSDPPPYKALSWTRGEATQERHILVGNRRLPINENLDKALRRIRLSIDPSYLWVDAICINQDDIGEKDIQVAMMPQIYEAATQVIAYLGEQADHSELLPQFFDATVRARRLLDGLDDDEKPDEEDIMVFTDTFQIDGLSQKDHKMWRAARAFYGRPWIMRVWIVQEFIAAKDLLFLCGNWKLPGDLIEESVKAAVLFSHLSPFDWNSDDPNTTNLKGLAHLLGMGSLRSDGPIGSQDLMYLFGITRKCQASDRRDKVFAVLGASQQAHSPALKPDYGETWRETYLRYSQYFIKEGSSLQLLYLASTESGWLYQQSWDLPSWVPDFSCDQYLDSLVRPAGDDQYEAGGHDSSSFRLSKDSRALLVDAIILDRIFVLGQSHNQGDIGNNYDRVFRFRAELEELWPLASAYHSDDKQDILCHVLLCDQEIVKDGMDIDTARYTIWPDHDCDYGCFDYVDEFAEREGKQNEYIRGAISRCKFRQRCVTSRGFLGQVPKLAREDDCIAIIPGSFVPFVLRPHGDQYRLVGQAYIHKIMRGETFDIDEIVTEEIEII